MLKRLVVIFFLLGLWLNAFCQGPPPPPPPPNGCPYCIPIDGGLVFLIVAGLALSMILLNKKRIAKTS